MLDGTVFNDEPLDREALERFAIACMVQVRYSRGYETLLSRPA